MSAARSEMPALTYVESGRMAVVREPRAGAAEGETFVEVRVCGIWIRDTRSQVA